MPHQKVISIGKMVDSHQLPFVEARELIHDFYRMYPESFGALSIRFALFAGACKESGINIADVKVIIAKVALNYADGTTKELEVPNGVSGIGVLETDLITMTLPDNYRTIY